MTASDVSCLEDTLKNTDAELIKVWNDLHTKGDDNESSSLNEEIEHSGVDCSDQSIDEDEDPVAAFLRQQSLKKEDESKIQFESWAKAIPWECLSRWEHPRQESDALDDEEPCNTSQNQQTPSTNQSIIRDMVKNCIVDELYQEFIGKIKRKIHEKDEDSM